jgi:hypothetical protein
MTHCQVSGVKLRPGGACYRLLARLRRDYGYSLDAGAEQIGLHHATLCALLEIIEEQRAALIQCRDAAPEFAKRHASKALDRA